MKNHLLSRPRIDLPKVREGMLLNALTEMRASALLRHVAFVSWHEGQDACHQIHAEDLVVDDSLPAN